MPESLFFIKLKADVAQMFSCEFCEIFKNTILTEHLRATASRDNKHAGKTFVPPLHGGFFNRDMITRLDGMISVPSF